MRLDKLAHTDKIHYNKFVFSFLSFHYHSVTRKPSCNMIFLSSKLDANCTKTGTVGEIFALVLRDHSFEGIISNWSFLYVLDLILHLKMSLLAGVSLQSVQHGFPGYLQRNHIVNSCGLQGCDTT